MLILGKKEKVYIYYIINIKYKKPNICDSRLLTISHMMYSGKKKKKEEEREKEKKKKDTQIFFPRAGFGSSTLTLPRELSDIYAI